MKNAVPVCYIMTWTTAVLFNSLGKAYWFLCFL